MKKRAWLILAVSLSLVSLSSEAADIMKQCMEKQVKVLNTPPRVAQQKCIKLLNRWNNLQEKFASKGVSSLMNLSPEDAKKKEALIRNKMEKRIQKRQLCRHHPEHCFADREKILKLYKENRKKIMGK